MKLVIFIILILVNLQIQNNPQIDLHEGLDKRFRSGKDAFFKFWGMETKYVRKARETV
jgi:hypothetical protein